MNKRNFHIIDTQHTILDSIKHVTIHHKITTYIIINHTYQQRKDLHVLFEQVNEKS